MQGGRIGLGGRRRHSKGQRQCRQQTRRESDEFEEPRDRRRVIRQEALTNWRSSPRKVLNGSHRRDILNDGTYNTHEYVILSLYLNEDLGFQESSPLLFAPAAGNVSSNETIP